MHGGQDIPGSVCMAPPCHVRPNIRLFRQLQRGKGGPMEAGEERQVALSPSYWMVRYKPSNPQLLTRTSTTKVCRCSSFMPMLMHLMHYPPGPPIRPCLAEVLPIGIGTDESLATNFIWPMPPPFVSLRFCPHWSGREALGNVGLCLLLV